MKKPKNSIERFAYKLKFWQALVIYMLSSFSLIVLLGYIAKTSTYNIVPIVIVLVFLFLWFVSSYIAILQTVYKILKKYQ